MHRFCLRAENREGIFLPYGKSPFIVCIIIAQTSSLEIICRGQGALSRDKNSSKINLFHQKKYLIWIWVRVSSSCKVPLQIAPHARGSTFLMSTMNACISRAPRNSLFSTSKHFLTVFQLGHTGSLLMMLDLLECKGILLSPIWMPPCIHGITPENTPGGDNWHFMEKAASVLQEMETMQSEPKAAGSWSVCQDVAGPAWTIPYPLSCFVSDVPYIDSFYI